MNMTIVAAYSACVVLIALGIFQLALILGAPLGRYAWGGAHRVLPLKFRIGSIASIVLYVAFALIILSKTGLVDVVSGNVADIGIWVLTVYFLIGVVINWVSRSKSERIVMTPVAFVLAFLCFLVAIG
jgi:hypothetical protein